MIRLVEETGTPAHSPGSIPVIPVAAFRARFELGVQIAGLAATAWLAWETAVGPYWGAAPGYLMVRLTSGFETALGALAFGAVLTLILRTITRHLCATGDQPFTLRSAAAPAVWFAPATLLFLSFSIFGIVAGLILVVTTTRLLGALSPMPAELTADQRHRHFQVALLVSVGYQTAATAMLIHQWTAAAGLLIVSTALLTTAGAIRGAWADTRPSSLPRAYFGLVLTVLLALIAQWGSGFYSGRGRGGNSSAPGQESASRGASKQSESPPELPADSEVSVPGSYAGIILWPELKPVTTLVAPLPARGRTFLSASQSVSIPFGGEYWMYRSPYRRPPQNAHLRRGTPARLSFRTIDHFPLHMEAHQKLEQPVSVRCCSGLQLKILNADRQPQTVSLEVLLIDAHKPDSPQSLGRARVTTVPDLAADKPTPIPETLTFSFSSGLQISQFDEISVIFHREFQSVDRSARIAIDRFVLTPSGS